jgi:2'-5' RNA ligase
MIRLFTALEIEDEAAERLIRLQRGIDGARWIERDDLHLTLRFFGDMPENVADDLDAELALIPFTPLTIELEGVGVFGGAKPTALYVGVKPSDSLSLLQQRHEAAARRVGLSPDKRNFMPHVTIARLRHVEAAEAYGFVMAHNLFAAPPFSPGRVVLLSSRNSQGGGPYRCERTYPDDDLYSDEDWSPDHPE